MKNGSSCNYGPYFYDVNMNLNISYYSTSLGTMQSIPNSSDLAQIATKKGGLPYGAPFNIINYLHITYLASRG